MTTATTISDPVVYAAEVGDKYGTIIVETDSGPHTYRMVAQVLGLPLSPPEDATDDERARFRGPGREVVHEGYGASWLRVCGVLRDALDNHDAPIWSFESKPFDYFDTGLGRTVTFVAFDTAHEKPGRFTVITLADGKPVSPQPFSVLIGL